MLVAAYGVWLVAVGPGLTTVTPDGGPAIVSHDPNPAGLLPVVAAALLLVGVWRNDRRPTLVGVAIVAGFAVVFLFSIGGILIPVAAVLFVLLAARQLLRPRDAGDGA